MRMQKFRRSADVATEHHLERALDFDRRRLDGGGWLVAAVIMAITIIGIPWARAAFNIAS